VFCCPTTVCSASSPSRRTRQRHHPWRPGNDTIYGGDGDDYLYGDAGEDSLYGDNAGVGYGYGGDTLDGGDDADHLYGGNGNDLFIGTADDHNDVFDGQEMSDTLTGHDAGDTHYNIEVFN